MLGENEEQEYEINNLLCSFEDIFPLIHDPKKDNKEKVANVYYQNDLIKTISSNFFIIGINKSVS